MIRRHALLTVPAGLALAAPLTAASVLDATFGEQPVPIGAGARALGMGGAFTAVADDASAATWNPAGLTQCERPELAASMGWYSTSVSSAASRGDNQAFRPDSLSGMLPFFALGCQQVVGVAWQRQFDFTSNLYMRSTTHIAFGPGATLDAADSWQVERRGAFTSLGACYAIEARPGLSFGLTLNLWGDRWTHQSAYSEDTSGVDNTTLSFGGVTNTFIQSQHIAEEVRVRRGTSVVLGGFWQATPSLTVALVVKPGFDLHLDHETVQHDHIVQSGSPTIDNTFSDNRDVVLHHPPSATLGLAWREDDLTTVAFDTTWTRWRLYYVDDVEGRQSPFSFDVDPDEFRDLMTYRLGWEHVVILPSAVLVPRLGAMLEFLPAVTKMQSTGTTVDTTSDRWVGATAGVSLCQRRVIYDVGIQVRHGDGVGANTYSTIDNDAVVTQVTARLGVTVQF